MIHSSTQKGGCFPRKTSREPHKPDKTETEIMYWATYSIPLGPVQDRSRQNHAELIVQSGFQRQAMELPSVPVEKTGTHFSPHLAARSVQVNSCAHTEVIAKSGPKSSLLVKEVL